MKLYIYDLSLILFPLRLYGIFRKNKVLTCIAKSIKNDEGSQGWQSERLIFHFLRKKSEKRKTFPNDFVHAAERNTTANVPT